MKLSATHAFNCIVLVVKFARTSCKDILLALLYTAKISMHTVVFFSVYTIILQAFLWGGEWWVAIKWWAKAMLTLKTTKWHPLMPFSAPHIT